MASSGTESNASSASAAAARNGWEQRVPMAALIDEQQFQLSALPGKVLLHPLSACCPGLHCVLFSTGHSCIGGLGSRHAKCLREVVQGPELVASAILLYVCKIQTSWNTACGRRWQRWWRARRRRPCRRAARSPSPCTRWPSTAAARSASSGARCTPRCRPPSPQPGCSGPAKAVPQVSRVPCQVACAPPGVAEVACPMLTWMYMPYLPLRWHACQLPFLSLCRCQRGGCVSNATVP